MQIFKLNPLFLLGGIILLFFFACTKEDQYKKDFIDGREDEFIYAGKGDSIRVFPGKNRIKIAFLMQSDPDVDRAVIYWNGRTDSIAFSIDQTGDVVKVEKILELKEGTYGFEIITFDKNGFSSVPADVTGRSYGDDFQNTLLNRPVLSSRSRPDGEAVIEWGKNEPSSIGTEVSYVTADDEERIRFIPSSETESILENFRMNSSFEYRTLFLPDSLSIDTFYASVETYQPDMPEAVMLDKGLFGKMSLQSDNPYDQDGYYHQQKWAWDGYYNTDPDDFESTSNNTSHKYQSALTGDSPRGSNPSWITIDLGVEANLTKFVLHTYFPFAHSTPKEYEIWGNMEAVDDFDDESWIKLGKSENLPPSGDYSNNINRSQEDIEAWIEGDEVELDFTNKVRYIRFKLLENYKSTTQIQIAEIDLYGYE